MTTDVFSELKPDPKKCSCGIVSFTLNSNHTKKNFDASVYFLTTFRQYVEFHVRMVKVLIHSNMRKRISRFEIAFEKALRLGPAKIGEYREKYFGAEGKDANEEEKISTVIKRAISEEEYTIG
jgi:hypothetical protein